MGKNKRENIVVQGTHRFHGQGLLLSAAVLSLISLLINVYASHLESTFAQRKEDERYFFMNYQSISLENVKRNLMHGGLNQLKILRRIGSVKLTQEEKKALLSDEAYFESSINASFKKMAAGTYLQANEPPTGMSPEEYIDSLSPKELQEKMPVFEKEASAYVSKIKKEMIGLKKRIRLWRLLYSSILIISTILIVFANRYLFIAATPGRN